MPGHLGDGGGDPVLRAGCDGGVLYALGAALAWVGDQPAFALRADHLFDIITGAILTTRP